MNQISPHSLWVGHAGDGRNVPALYDAGIKALVHLAVDEPSPTLPLDFIFLRFPLVDGGENGNHVLLLALGTVAHLLQMHLPTLVYCSAGMSRAPAIAAGGLCNEMVSRTLDLVTAQRYSPRYRVPDTISLQSPAGALAITTRSYPGLALAEVARHRPADVSSVLWADVRGHCQRIMGLAQ